MNESEKQFSFTRAASSTSGRAENQIPISDPAKLGTLGTQGGIRKALISSLGADILTKMKSPQQRFFLIPEAFKTKHHQLMQEIMKRLHPTPSGQKAERCARIVRFSSVAFLCTLLLLASCATERGTSAEKSSLSTTKTEPVATNEKQQSLVTIDMEKLKERRNLLVAYKAKIGILTFPEFLADGWNATDPFDQILGVVYAENNGKVGTTTVLIGVYGPIMDSAKTYICKPASREGWDAVITDYRRPNESQALVKMTIIQGPKPAEALFVPYALLSFEKGRLQTIKDMTNTSIENWR